MIYSTNAEDCLRIKIWIRSCAVWKEVWWASRLVKHFPVQSGILYGAIFFIVNYCREGKAAFFALIFWSFMRHRSYLYSFQLEQIYSPFFSFFFYILELKIVLASLPFIYAFWGKRWHVQNWAEMIILCKCTNFQVFFSLSYNLSSFWYWKWFKKVLFQHSGEVQLLLGGELHNSVTRLGAQQY